MDSAKKWKGENKRRHACALRDWRTRGLFFYGTSKFKNEMNSDEDFVADNVTHGDSKKPLNVIRKRIFELIDANEYAEAQKSIDTCKYTVEYLNSVHVIIERHLIRLRKYFEQLQITWTETNNLPDAIVKDKTRRAFELIQGYSSMNNFLKECSEQLEAFIKKVESETAFQHKEIFAKRLKEARKAAGLTQTQLATKIGMKQSGYAPYEKMTREPSLQTLARLSKILKRSTDWLLGLTP